jgi:predicted nucleotidyltransferase
MATVGSVACARGLSRWRLEEPMGALRELEARLRKHKPYLRREYKVKEIGIFGSYSRGEESTDSDVDILVEFCEPIGWEFVDLQETLEGILGRRVDLVTVGALKPQLRDRILSEVSYA